MEDLFHINKQILGVIGHPIKHTFSPFIHNKAAQILDLDMLYLPFDVPPSSLKDALKGMIALGLKGFNVTIPHKESIIPYLHHLSEEASIVGSINTIVNDHNELAGYNTDVHGIYESLLPFKDDISGKSATVLGAGGTARAVIFCLIRHFKVSSIHLVNRTVQRAETLKDYFIDSMRYEDITVYELVPPDLVSLLQRSKLIINTTQLGMYPEIDDSPITHKEAFTKDQIVFDAIYNPLKTVFLKMAEEQGATAINGIKMLTHQAAKSFELWTGIQMPVDKILEEITNYYKES